MTSPWPIGGPAAHDALADLSNAPLAELGALSIAPLDADPPLGWIEQVDGRGVFLRRTETGPEDTTEPDAWYVHGLAGSSTNWTSLVYALADRARGYVVDLPGHGRSDPPPRGRYSLADDADVLAVLIRRYSAGPIHLVGNSLGAMVSVALAARHPDLVRSLTLISPAVPDLRLGRDRGGDARLGILLLPGTTGMATRRLASISPMQRARGMAELCFGDATSITDAEFQAAADDLGWRFGLPWVHTGTIGSLRALISSYLRTGAFRTAAAAIHVPTLVIWGTRDRLVDPRLAARTAEAFPDASLLILAGVGHTAQMERPAITARAVAAVWARAGASHRSTTPAVATSST